MSLMLLYTSEPLLPPQFRRQAIFFANSQSQVPKLHTEYAKIGDK